jgi:hypothetical protein
MAAKAGDTQAALVLDLDQLVTLVEVVAAQAVKACQTD